MKIRLTSLRRQGMIARALSLAALLLPALAFSATVNWVGGSGDWNTPANWSTGAVPGVDDDVVIDRPGEVVISHTSGSHSVKSIQSQEEMTLSGGTLVVSGTFQTSRKVTFSGGTLQSATLSSTGGAQLISTGGSFDGVTLASDLTVSGNLFISNGFTINGTSKVITTGGIYTRQGNHAINGTGEILLENGGLTAGYGGASTLTLGAGLKIRGWGHISQSSQAAIVNLGTLRAEGATRSLVVQPGTFTNQGNAEVAAQAHLQIRATTWSNPGTITAVADSNLSLASNWTMASAGNIVSTGATVNIVGTVTGGVALTAQTGNWRLGANGIIQGGLVTGANAHLIAAGGTLDGVTLECNVTGDNLFISNGLTFNGGAKLESIGNILVRQGNQTLGGNGEIVMAGGNLTVGYGGVSTVTLGAQTVIRGWGSIYQSSLATLVNGGNIIAEGANRTLSIQMEVFTNQNTLRSTAGAHLHLRPVGWTGTGAIIAETSSTLSLGGNWSWATAGTITGPEAAVNIVGTVTGGLALTAETGSWRLSSNGVIQGGHVTGVGAQLIAAGGTLDGVTLKSNVTGDNLNIVNGLTFNDGAKLDAIGNVYVRQGNQTLSGDGEIVMSGGGLILGYGGPSTVTLGSQTKVRGWGSIYQSSPATLVNGGIIRAEGENRTLSLQVEVFTNNGTAEAAAGAHLHIRPTSWTNTGTINAQPASTLSLGGAWSSATAGTITGPGATVNLTGTITGGLTLTGATGSWRLGSGSVIQGGTITSSGGAQFIAAGGRLDGVTVKAEIIGDSLSIINGLTLEVGAKLSSISNVYFLQGDQTIGGGGEIIMNGGGLIVGYGGVSTVTFGSQLIVRGWGSIYQSSPATLVNNGTLRAEGVNRALTVQPATVVNHGTFQATADAHFNLRATDWSSTALITADAGSTLTLGGNWSWSTAGDIAGTGATVNVAGTVSGGVSLDAQTGSWRLVSGGIVRGVVNAQDGQQLIAAGGTLDGATVSSDMTGDSLVVINGLGFTDGAQLSVANVYLRQGDQLLQGEGEIVLAGGGLILAYGGDSTVTIGAGVTVSGWGSIYQSSPATLVNSGNILASVPTRTLSIQTANFLNQGHAGALAGAHLDIRSTDWSNTGVIEAAATSTLSLGGNWTLAGVGTILSPGATVNLTGTVTGGLALTAQTGNWRLANSGVIRGGTVNAGGGTSLIAAGGTLDGVTLASQISGNGLQVINGLALTNGAKVTVDSSLLLRQGVNSITGDGEIILQGSILYLGYGGASTVTFGPQITVRGFGGIYQSSPATLVNEGSIVAEGVNRTFTVQMDSLTNYGTLSAVGGARLLVPVGGSTNLGPMQVIGGTIDFDGLIQIDDPVGINLQQQSSLLVGGNLIGSTRNVAAHSLRGILTFNRASTPATPQLMEVMGRDIGPEAVGFTNNFAVGSLVVSTNSNLRLIDDADNSAGQGPEALYLDSLIVQAGASLDLNGLKVYARTAQITGAVLGDTLVQIPDSGPLAFDSPTAGGIAVAGELDEWTFFARAGQLLTIHVETGGTSVLAPAVGFIHASLLDSQGNVLAEGTHPGSGQLVALPDIEVPADGTYRLHIKAPANRVNQIGNYRVAVWSVIPDVAPLVLNQQHLGMIENPYSVDRWTFSAAAGQQVRFDLVNASSPGATFTLRGPDGWIGFENLAVDSSLITLPASGDYSLSASGTGMVFNLSYAFRLLETVQTDLALDDLHTANLTGAGQAHLFRIDVTEVGPLRLFLQNAGAGNRLELFVSRGAPPTRESSDFQSASGPGSSRNVLVPTATPGTWYVLVYADKLPTPGSFTIQAAQSGVVLAGVSPAQHSGNIAATLALSGAGFAPGTAASLVAGNGTVYPLANVAVDTFTRITATVPANAVPAGTYSIRLQQPGGASSTLENAYTVLAPGFANLQTKLVMPGSLGRHAFATIYVEYSNTGNASMPAPLLVLKSSDPDGSDRPILTLDQSRIIQNFWSNNDSLPPGTSNEIYILASGEQPGLLHPGERIQVPVYYIGLQQPWDFSDGTVEMQIRYWTADDESPTDWSGRKEALRPPTLAAPVWDIIYANLTSGLATTADYIRMLNDNAQYLGRLGQRVTSVDDLWNFEVMQAYGISVLPVLDTAADASIPVPGGTLGLERSFASNIRSRQESGPFGRGWRTRWQDRAVALNGGNLVQIIGDSGSARVYSKDTRDGSYFSPAGDTSRLTSIGSGVYQLAGIDGQITRFRAADGRIDYTQDANGNRVTAGWDGTGRLTSLTHNSGASITLSYNGAGLITSLTESTGRTVAYTYTGGALATATTDDGKVTSYTYVTAGNAAQLHALATITREGVTRNFTWDTAGRLASSWLASGEETTTFGYDTAAAMTVTIGGGTSAFYLDHRGLVAKSVDALGNITTPEFDANLRLRRLTLPTGESQGYTWNDAGLPATITDELGYTSAFRYDHPLKKLTRFTDANGNITRFNHDPKGNVLSVDYADGSAENLGTYTPAGLPQSLTNRRGDTIQSTYNSIGRLQRKTYPGGRYDDFSYDTRGNLTQISRHPSAGGGGEVTTYLYHTATDGDRLKRVEYPGGSWVEYTYDTHGRRTRITDSASGDTRHTYDSAGRLWKTSNAAGLVLAEYLYDSAGRLARINKGNGTYTTYTRDAAGNILDLANRAPDGSASSRFTYTYDSRGRRASLTTLDGAWAYTHDAAGQLIRAVFTATTPGVPHQDLRYTYDGLGNRTATLINGETTTYTANNLNQYVEVGGTVQHHDPDGNLTSDGANAYEYDVESRLIRITGPGGVTEYEYNALGHRTAAIVNGVRTDYLLDPSGEVNVLAERTGATTTGFTQGWGLVSTTTGGTPTYFDYDAIGSTVGTSSAAGLPTGSTLYLPFGGEFVSDLPAGTSARFVGQFGVATPAAGPASMRTRHYLASTGRFTSPDPLGLAGGLNLYRYAGNRPGSLIDPSGLAGFHPWGPLGSSSSLRLFLGIFCHIHISPGGKHIHCIHIIVGIPGYIRPGWVVIIVTRPVVVIVIVPNPSPGGPGGGGPSGPAPSPGGPGGSFPFPIPWPFPWPDWPPFPPLPPYPYPSPYPDPLPDPPPPPPEDPPPGDGPGSDGDDGGSGSAQSVDPNEKIGPAGYGPQSWIQADALMPYRINFENLGPGSKDPDGNPYPIHATAPAQRVTVTDPLADTLDWSTFRFTEFGFGDIIVPIPGGSSHFSETVSMTYNGKTFDVEVTGSIDYATGIVFVRYQSIDPGTSLPPDVLTGFLPPEDGTGRGMGHVSFTIRSRADLPTATPIRNVAVIKFDINEVIATDQVDPQDPSKGVDPDKQALVTLDGSAPSSSIGVLPGEVGTTEFLVSWSGSDPGSGIGGYDIYVSIDGGPWTLWQSFPAEVTSALYQGQLNHSYGFYSIARDRVGNVQPTPTGAQAGTTVTDNPIAAPPVLRISAVRQPGGTVRSSLTYEVVSGYTYTVQYNDNLGTVPGWQPLPGAPHPTGTVTDETTATKRFYRLIRTPVSPP